MYMCIYMHICMHVYAYINHYISLRYWYQLYNPNPNRNVSPSVSLLLAVINYFFLIDTILYLCRSGWFHISMEIDFITHCHVVILISKHHHHHHIRGEKCVPIHELITCSYHVYIYMCMYIYVYACIYLYIYWSLYFSYILIRGEKCVPVSELITCSYQLLATWRKSRYWLHY
jgi:hypothetical protein